MHRYRRCSTGKVTAEAATVILYASMTVLGASGDD